MYDTDSIIRAVKNAVNEYTGFGGSEMTLELALHLTEEVKKEAVRLGVKAVVAVADAGGNIISHQSMNGAFIASRDIAENKAFTSVALKMPTKDLSKLAAPGGSLYGIQNTNGGRIVIFGGGVPLVSGDGKFIGGLGVSGGTAEQDTALGDYGAKVFNKLI